jgi:RNA polymerase sigma-70 factor (ECF subfamily)
MNNNTLLQLLEDCKAHDATAEKALFLHFAPKVLAIARRYATDEPMAQDYLQECFLVLFDKLSQYDPGRGQFEGWLYRVSVNTILQLMRKQKRLPEISHPETLPDVELEETVLDQIPHEQVLDAVRQLPAGYRQVLNLYIFEDWSHREIAEALQISESASRSQLSRAKQLLKQMLHKAVRYYEQGLV